MSVNRAEDGTIVLAGSCPVEDAEPLLQMLLAAPGAHVDWSQCQKPHTAVIQVLMAAGVAPPGPCGDNWTAQWFKSAGQKEQKGKR